MSEPTVLPIVVKEVDVRRKVDLDGLSREKAEDKIQAVVTDSGIDYGRTVYVKDEAPNRQWSNHRDGFESTPEEKAAAEAEKKAKELAELTALEAEKKKTAALEAEIAQLKKGNTDGTLHVKGKAA